VHASKLTMLIGNSAEILEPKYNFPVYYMQAAR